MAMNILICGAGTIARELLRQLGEEWSVTLIDKSQEVLEQAAALSPNIRARFVEDGSSPVVLEQAEIGTHQYVLAMTGSDAVNLALCRFAREQGVPYVSALVHEPENGPGFQKLGVHVIMTGTLTARNLFHYLQDPRVHVSPLTGGMANVYEVNAAEHFRVVGKRAAYFQRSTLRLVGIFRQGKLLFPHPRTVIQADDRLILLGETDIFNSVCSLLACASPHFPLAYGPTMLVALPRKGADVRAVLQEGQFLGQNTKVRKVTIFCDSDRCDVDEAMALWPQEISVEVRPSGEGLLDRVRRFAGEGGCGLVLVPPVEGSFIAMLTGSTTISLAHDLGCPVLIARRTVPYGNILVPFRNSPASELALEVAIDLAKQLGAQLSVMVVEEPEFLSGERDGSFLESALGRVRELAHVHKVSVKEISASGNPVHAIVKESTSHDLLVIGSSNRDRGLISPNIGDHLVRKAQCSTLIVTA